MIRKVFKFKSLKIRSAALLALLFLGLELAPAAQASFNSTPSGGRFAGNVNFVVAGGTLRLYSNCTCTRANTIGQAGTRSSGPLTLPSGAALVAAYLYWGGSGPTVDATVTIEGSRITAGATFTDTFEPTVYNLSFFGGSKDLTGNSTNLFVGATVEVTRIYTGSPVATMAVTDDGGRALMASAYLAP